MLYLKAIAVGHSVGLILKSYQLSIISRLRTAAVLSTIRPCSQSHTLRMPSSASARLRLGNADVRKFTARQRGDWPPKKFPIVACVQIRTWYNGATARAKGNRET